MNVCMNIVDTNGIPIPYILRRRYVCLTCYTRSENFQPLHIINGKMSPANQHFLHNEKFFKCLSRQGFSNLSKQIFQKKFVCFSFRIFFRFSVALWFRTNKTFSLFTLIGINYRCQWYRISIALNFSWLSFTFA